MRTIDRTAGPSSGSKTLDVDAERLLAQREAWHQAAVWPEASRARRALVVLPREDLSARTARTLVAAMCADLENFDVGDVVLVTGELVANAILHTAPPPDLPDTVTVAVIVTGTDLRVEVGDLDPRPATERQAAPGAEHGRGMSLIDALCDQHGATAFDGGKVSWARWDLN